MTDPEASTTPPERTSGWEKADKVAHGAGRVLEGTGWLIVKAYAIGLVLIGIVLFFINPGAAWWASLLLIAYGVYLLVPGSKIVVW